MTRSRQPRRRLSIVQWLGVIGFVLVFVLVAAVANWRGAIIRGTLNPRAPFQVYQPPSAPDYANPDAWALLEDRAPDSGEAAIFFVHSTTYDGGDDWNGPIDDVRADAYLNRVVLPNYAAPFARAGAISAPHYRQGSLYARLTVREDGREARAFAYRDIEAAFDVWLARHPSGPLILAGVEQGGDLLARLLSERVQVDALLRSRLVAVYLINTPVPLDRMSPIFPACERRDETGCLVAWWPAGEDNHASALRGVGRLLVWNDRDRLVELGARELVCVNPVTGSSDTTPVEARAHRGATNATGLEWGARPALIARQVATQCRGGLLHHTELRSESFGRARAWTDRRKDKPYNLFYGDIEADVQTRLTMWRAAADPT